MWVLLVPMAQRIKGVYVGVSETGDEVKGKKAEGRFVAEGGSKQSTSGRVDTNAPDLLGQETGNSIRMGGSTSHIQCMCKVDGL